MEPSECPEECKDVNYCLNYVGCGPKPQCDDPCWKCCFWKNHGDVLRKMLNEKAGDCCSCKGDGKCL